MSRIRSKNTKPELAVRRALTQLGYRFRLHSQGLPGKPDICFPSRKKAIFVHGCFWHNHECSIGHLPKSRSHFWIEKFQRNRLRDEKNETRLKEFGWHSFTVWECQVADIAALKPKLTDFLEKPAKTEGSTSLREREGDSSSNRLQPSPLTFIDVFAGCGGLSLGLLRSGWNGMFAVEKDSMAFQTIHENLVKPAARYQFDWPNWLEKKPHAVETLLSDYGSQLAKLRGNVTLLAGGPPCQGFSSAGRRRGADPRNRLFEHYLKLVELVEPKIVFVENVPGMTFDFGDESATNSRRNYAAELQKHLAKDFLVFSSLVSAPDFGIPQVRRRFIIVGLSRQHFPENILNPFEALAATLPSFRGRRRLSRNIGSRAAISDLETAVSGLKASPDTAGFDAIAGGNPKTSYQRLMKDGYADSIPDTRLARHNPHIVKRFKKIMAHCLRAERLHVQLSVEAREKFGLKKKATRVLDPKRPSPTITSMPDDLIHYSEPRTLTVRENARIQSFPDWFAFQGKYTTGGKRRRNEVPRFTQVANAVPPLLAEAFGEVLKILAEQAMLRSGR